MLFIISNVYMVMNDYENVKTFYRVKLKVCLVCKLKNSSIPSTILILVILALQLRYARYIPQC